MRTKYICLAAAIFLAVAPIALTIGILNHYSATGHEATGAQAFTLIFINSVSGGSSLLYYFIGYKSSVK